MTVEMIDHFLKYNPIYVRIYFNLICDLAYKRFDCLTASFLQHKYICDIITRINLDLQIG